MPPINFTQDSEELKIDRILDRQVFKIKTDKPKDEPFWNLGRLLPNRNTDNIEREIEYRDKYLCEVISEGDRLVYERLYNDTLMSEVWDYYFMKMVENYVRKNQISSRG